VTDPIYEDVAGRYRLTVGGGVGTVERTDEQADLELSVGVLGSILMGGHGADLGRAGRLRGSIEAIDRADLIFGWPIAPFVQEIF
jgi:predicted acetyltransferase